MRLKLPRAASEQFRKYQSNTQQFRAAPSLAAGGEGIALFGDCLLSMHQDLGLVPSTTQTGYGGGVHWSTQLLGGETQRILSCTSSRPAWDAGDPVPKQKHAGFSFFS